METVDGIIKYVSEWRQHNSYTLASDGSLSEESLWKLMNDVNSKIEKLAYEKHKKQVLQQISSLVVSLKSQTFPISKETECLIDESLIR